MWICSSIGFGSSAAKKCFFQLACTVGSLSIAILSLVSLHEPSDRVSNQFGLFLSSMGFVHFVSLTRFLHNLMLETSSGIKFMKKYKLCLSDVLDITNKLVSVVQAAFSCIAGIIVCRWSCTKNFLYASHFLSESYAWFGAAYFFYDIWSMYRVTAAKTASNLKAKLRATIANNGKAAAEEALNGVSKKMLEKTFYDKHNGNKNVCNGAGDHAAELCELLDNEIPTVSNGSLSIFVSSRAGVPSFVKYIFTHPIMVLHHIFIGSYGLVVITSKRGQMGDCIFTTIYLMELSTPFVSIRGILSLIGLKNSRKYVVNGLLMLITFFLCRIVLIPYVMYLYSVTVNLGFFEAAASLPRGCKWSIAIISLPQFYWFYLMLKGATKVFFPSKQKKVNSNNNQTFPNSEPLITGKITSKLD